MEEEEEEEEEEEQQQQQRQQQQGGKVEDGERQGTGQLASGDSGETRSRFIFTIIITPSLTRGRLLP